MQKDQRDQLKALYDQASKGPWKVFEHPRSDCEIRCQRGDWPNSGKSFYSYEDRKDAEFSAAAHESLPELLRSDELLERVRRVCEMRGGDLAKDILKVLDEG